VYPKNPPVSNETNSSAPIENGGEDAMVKREESDSQILEAIPEAKLLDPGLMLTFSKGIFMNRSSDFPSPWPHWSVYTSELAAEPAMYRTAFSDFHTLVVSVTKRLVQSAIIQATSRLRAQRHRKIKGTLPLVKIRDIHAAVDVLGMARNGVERWRGVPRRCGLKVVESEPTSTGRRNREIAWSEVERFLSPTTSTNERSASEAATSAEPENFRSRATRSGTPLPIHSLTLSDSESGSDRVKTTDDEDGDSSDDLERFADDPPPARHAWQARDNAGRYASVLRDATGEDLQHGLQTLEDFDQEASRQEEVALWSILNMRPAELNESKKIKDSLHNDSEMDERVGTTPDDWREILEYKAPWETYKTPVSKAKMLANQKSPSPMPASHGTHTVRGGSTSDDHSNALSSEQPRRQRARSRTEVELRARGTNAYAALQRDDLDHSDPRSESSSSGAESEMMEQDVPAKSIEATHDTEDIYESVSGMDWT
jgi:RNA polymerase I-specific transcription initiation factor RRN5